MDLLLLTKFYPYGTEEAFIENEIKVLSEHYERIVIIACDVPKNEKHIRILPQNAVSFRINAFSKKKCTFVGLFKSFSNMPFFREEEKNCSGIMQRVFLRYFETKSHKIFDEILRNGYLSILENKQFVLYSYWMFMTARVGTLISEVQKPVMMITRAHRYDLYAEMNKLRYLPYRKFFLATYNNIFPCSENGAKYLREGYPDYSDKIKVSLLGTIDNGLGKEKGAEKVFRIVSCSRMEPVKRVSMIAKALALLDDKGLDIEWVHIGGGSEFEMVDKLSKDLLRNIRVRLVGNMQNQQVMEMYRNVHFDLFINVSSSEGLPVSIMEAISFGIPCIATDVGGTSEIVIDGITGKLIPDDFSETMLAELIQNFMMNYDEKLKESSRSYWEKNFQAVVNYKKLCDYIDDCTRKNTV